MTQEMNLKDEDSFIRQECEELGVLEVGTSTRKSKSLGIHRACWRMGCQDLSAGG